MIVLVIEGLIDVDRLLDTDGEVLLEIEADIEVETLLDKEGEVVVVKEGDCDTVCDVEPLADWFDDEECDWDSELLLEAVEEMVWIPDDVAVDVGEVLLDLDDEGDIDDVVEGLGVTEWETVVLGVNDDVLVWLDTACVGAIKRMTKINNDW